MGKSYAPPPQPDPTLLTPFEKGYLGAPGPFERAGHRRDRVLIGVLLAAAIAIPGAASYGIYVFIQLALAEFTAASSF